MPHPWFLEKIIIAMESKKQKVRKIAVKSKPRKSTKPKKKNAKPRKAGGKKRNASVRSLLNTELNSRFGGAPASVQARASRGNNFEKVAQSICIPSENWPIRFADKFSAAPTAIASPWAAPDTQWTGTDTPNTHDLGGMTKFQMAGFAFRNAERAFVIYNANTAEDLIWYDLFGNDPALASAFGPKIPASTWSVPSNSGLGNWCALHCPFAKVDSASEISPHGEILLAGGDGETEGRYFWMDKGMSSLMVCNSDSLVNYSVQRWTPSGIAKTAVTATMRDVPPEVKGLREVRKFLKENPSYKSPQKPESKRNSLNLPEKVNTAFSLEVIITESGYYAPMFIAGSPDEDITDIEIDFQGNMTTWEHHHLPDFDNNAPSVKSIRISAASMMYTNDASPLNRQGKIAMIQSPEGSSWTDLVGPFTLVSELQGAVIKNAEKGAYGFLKPTKEDDFTAQKFTKCYGPDIVDSCYPLSGDAFLAMTMEVKDLDGQDGYWTFAWGIEYYTTDVWRTISPPVIAAHDYEAGLEFIKSIPQFHENPTHLSDLWNSIKSAAKTVIGGIKQYGPMVMSGAQMLGSLI